MRTLCRQTYGTGTIRLVVALALGVSSTLIPSTEVHPATVDSTKVPVIVGEISNPLSHRFDPMAAHYLYSLRQSQVRSNRGLARSTVTPTTALQRQEQTGSVWDALARCESGNTNDHNAPYYGYWQFSGPTWRSLGYTGNADEYPREVQLEAAIRLQARSGWGQWPKCSRTLGLR